MQGSSKACSPAQKLTSIRAELDSRATQPNFSPKHATTAGHLLTAANAGHILRSSVDANTAQLENLNIHSAYCTHPAPINGAPAWPRQVRQPRACGLTPRRLRPSSIRRHLRTYFLRVPRLTSVSLRQALDNESASIERSKFPRSAPSSGQGTMIETRGPRPARCRFALSMPTPTSCFWPGGRCYGDSRSAKIGFTVPSTQRPCEPPALTCRMNTDVAQCGREGPPCSAASRPALTVPSRRRNVASKRPPLLLKLTKLPCSPPKVGS